ncbi:MAG: type III-B CRISPR module-associated protein Cmr5 [Armatimonadota bacterium]|nr:type III-B CRISPR module-associated protein Cmr5 [Armatimonadota bacterium]
MPGVRTLDQERAAYAWAKLVSCTGEYVNLVKGAPALVMGNGLMQALAYYQDKSNDGRQLVKHIGQWLKQRGLTSGDDFESVMRSLHESDALKYMHATTETLELLKWIKQIGAAKQAREGTNA